MYPAELVEPMKLDLTSSGFEDLTSAEEVDNVLEEQEGTVLLVVNSVCGCAAGNARPGVKMSLSQSDKKPERLVTVFAGVDTEATQKAREFLLPYPPSSPSIALFRNGKLVHMLERHQIEGRPAALIAQNLAHAYESYC
ncbi:MAG: BrxA/BrxB family bacilliredoxin [Bacteroidia bacterium]